MAAKAKRTNLSDVVIVVRIAQRTHRSLLVIPHGNQERAAWLEIGKVKEMDQLLDGSTRIMAPADLVSMRGLDDVVERSPLGPRGVGA